MIWGLSGVQSSESSGLIYGEVPWYPDSRQWGTAVIGVPENRSPFSDSFSPGEKMGERNSRWLCQLGSLLAKALGDLCSKGCKHPH